MEPLPVGKLPPDLLTALLRDVSYDADVIIGPGIGRDAAAVRVGEQILVLKTDPVTFPTDDPGWYLVNINANDIACMGATPKWLLVTALLPEKTTTPELVESIFTSLQRTCAELGCSLIGGHTEVTEGLDRPMLIGQMIGVTTEDSLIDLTRAQPGDAVLLIGGIAVEGTSILANDAADLLRDLLEPAMLQRAAEFARLPGISVVPYARRLVDHGHVNIRAMHDPTEGGIATGLRELADATGLGIEIDASTIHIHPETAAITDALNIDPLGLIASGALLAVVSDESAARALDAFQDLDAPARRIGHLTSDPLDRAMIVDGKREVIPEFAVDEIARYFAGS